MPVLEIKCFGGEYMNFKFSLCSLGMTLVPYKETIFMVNLGLHHPTLNVMGTL
jgi:hypothetical protein